jgi:hypothetical protein
MSLSFLVSSQCRASRNWAPSTATPFFPFPTRMCPSSARHHVASSPSEFIRLDVKDEVTMPHCTTPNRSRRPATPTSQQRRSLEMKPRRCEHSLDTTTTWDALTTFLIPRWCWRWESYRENPTGASSKLNSSEPSVAPPRKTRQPPPVAVVPSWPPVHRWMS